MEPMSPQVSLDREAVSAFCQRHYIKRLALFGSVLRDDFSPDSDVDVLVEFQAGHVPGLNFVSIEREFSGLLHGRRVDMIHLIQIIGEAERQVSPEFSERHPEVPWTEIIGMRHKVVHDYLGVDEDIVWQVVTGDLPKPVAALAPIVPRTAPVTNE